jgi:hypothetical protein
MGHDGFGVGSRRFDGSRHGSRPTAGVGLARSTTGVGHGLTIDSGLVFFFSGKYGKWPGFGRWPARLHGFRHLAAPDI